jgi:carbon monoxide dehydrogenase subunit G
VEIEKTLTVAASPDAVWTALLDPRLMAECVPGMQSVDVISPTEYSAVIAVKIAFISARFKLRTTLVEQRAPNYLRTEGTGEDKSVASALKQTSELFLSDLGDGRTELRTRVVVDVTGRLGTFGLSVMKTKADRMWDEFCANLVARLAPSPASDVPTASHVADTANGTVPDAAPDAAPGAAPGAALGSVSGESAGDHATAGVAASQITAHASGPQATRASAPIGTSPSHAAPVIDVPAPATREAWSWLPWRRASSQHIHICVRRGDTEIRVQWPVQAGAQCAAWLQSLTR